MLYDNEEIFNKFREVFHVNNLKKCDTDDLKFIKNTTRKLVDDFEMDIWFNYKKEELSVYVTVDNEGLSFDFSINEDTKEIEKKGLYHCLSAIRQVFNEDPKMRIYRIVNI